MFDVAKVIETCNLAHVQPGALKDVNFLAIFWATLKERRRGREVEGETRHRAAQLHRGVAQLVAHLRLRRRLLLPRLPLPDELLGGGV